MRRLVLRVAAGAFDTNRCAGDILGHRILTVQHKCAGRQCKVSDKECSLRSPQMEIFEPLSLTRSTTSVFTVGKTGTPAQLDPKKGNAWGKSVQAQGNKGYSYSPRQIHYQYEEWNERHINAAQLAIQEESRKYVHICRYSSATLTVL